MALTRNALENEPLPSESIGKTTRVYPSWWVVFYEDYLYYNDNKKPRKIVETGESEMTFIRENITKIYR